MTTHDMEREEQHAAIERILEKANQLQDAMYRLTLERDKIMSALNDARSDHFAERVLTIEAPAINLLDNAINQIDAADSSLSGANSYL